MSQNSLVKVKMRIAWLPNDPNPFDFDRKEVFGWKNDNWRCD